jgi:hypothetical protein
MKPFSFPVHPPLPPLLMMVVKKNFNNLGMLLNIQSKYFSKFKKIRGWKIKCGSLAYSSIREFSVL